MSGCARYALAVTRPNAVARHAVRRPKRRCSRQARGGGAGGWIVRECPSATAANVRASWSSLAGANAPETIPADAIHWLAHPVEVWHCGMVPQCGMALWHGQSAMPPSLVIPESALPSTPMVCCMPWHDLVIANPATGENPRVRAMRTANSGLNLGIMITLQAYSQCRYAQSWVQVTAGADLRPDRVSSSPGTPKTSHAGNNRKVTRTGSQSAGNR